MSSLSLNDVPVTATKVELPSCRDRIQRSLPSLPEHLFSQLIRLRGTCWAVYLVIGLRCQLERRRRVVLTSAFLSRFGLTRHDKRRALAALEKAGLIRVEKRDRKNPLVRLCEVNEA